MKNNGDYDYFAAVHRDAAGTGCAHGGQAFAGWHRELTKRCLEGLKIKFLNLNF